MNIRKNNNIKVLIVGSGKIGREYLKILITKKYFQVSSILSTSNKNLGEVKKITSPEIFKTDEKKTLKRNRFDLAIIAVPVNKTFKVSKEIMKYVRVLLIEKPPALTLYETLSLIKLSKKNKNKLFIGMNRANFDSTLHVKNLLKNSREKRIVEVTDQEDVRLAKKIGHAKIVLENWMYANSIHMIDYFRIFCRGKILKIEKLESFKSPFEKKIYICKILFSSGDLGIYKGYWNLKNRWQTKIILNSKIYNLLPLEELKIINQKTRVEKKIFLKKSKFKSGFYNQINSLEKYFKKKKNNLVEISECVKTIKLIKRLFY